MTSKSAGSRFLVSRAVEEPLEASLELGDHIKIISKRALVPMNLGIIAAILMVLLMIPSIYDILRYTREGVLGNESFSSDLLQNALISSAVIVFLFAIIITAFLYISQLLNFISKNLLHCCKISDLTEFKVAEKKEVKRDKLLGKHLKNPIYALMDLEEESIHILPQIVRMLRFCALFIAFALVIFILTIVLKIGFDYNLLFSMGLIRLGLSFVVVGKLFVILVLLLEAEGNFRYIHTRHNIIDSVRFIKDIQVPMGEDGAARLNRYLKENDPYIRASMLADKSKFNLNARLKGSNGTVYEFDSYFTGVNILKEKSVALGMPMGKFGVFIKVFRDEITLPKIKALRDSALDVCRLENMFPLRIIALQWSISDLPDDVYEYVLDEPIIMKNTQTNLEIIAEEGDIYSFIPMISYGEMIG